MLDNKKITEIKNLTNNIDGWLTDLEGELLCRLAKNCRGGGVIVEIGSWKGKSTIWLARGSLAGPKIPVYAIDPHIGSEEYDYRPKGDTFEEFQNNINNAEVDSLVIPIVKTSLEASKTFTGSVELLFIDGSHDYESVKKDFEIWFPKLVNGGTIVFHDSILLPGPAKIVKEYIHTSTNFCKTGFVHSSTYAKKVDHNSLTDRIRNRYVLGLKNLYAFSTKFSIPAPLKRVGGKFIRSIIN